VPADEGHRREALLRFEIGGLDLLLTADPGNPLGVGDDEDGLLPLGGQHGQREQRSDQQWLGSHAENLAHRPHESQVSARRGAGEPRACRVESAA